MFSMKTGLYSCDLCGFEGDFDVSDEIHGALWECEQCGDTFCSKCFRDKLGEAELTAMLQTSDRVLCPACWEKRKDFEK